MNEGNLKNKGQNNMMNEGNLKKLINKKISIWS